jgi:hypothetical protein
MVNVGDDAKISYVRCFHYFIKSEQESINGKPLKKSKFPVHASRFAAQVALFFGR